jgi:ubiquinol-cytochrome c reductase iron-sulfur subunit
MLGPSDQPTEAKATRRDVLRVATGVAGAAAVVGAVGATAYMLSRLDQMDSDAVAPPAPGTFDVDLSPLQPGQQIMVFWRSWPIFVLHRTPQAVTMLRNPELIEQLADPESDQLQQPPYAKNRQRSLKPEFAVLVGVCTHMGCTPQFYPQPDASEPVPDWLGGYFCPCHGSKYDLAGRVFQGVPAPLNLPVPPHHYPNDKTLRIGENPPDASFDFDSVEQV